MSAVVLNSGGANCYTGMLGFQVAHETAEAAGRALDLSPGRRARLLDRPDRRAARLDEGASAASAAPSRRSPTPVATTPPAPS